MKSNKIYACVLSYNEEVVYCKTTKLEQNFRFEIHKKYVKFNIFRGCEISLTIVNDDLIVKKVIPIKNKCEIIKEMETLIKNL